MQRVPALREETLSPPELGGGATRARMRRSGSARADDELRASRCGSFFTWLPWRGVAITSSGATPPQRPTWHLPSMSFNGNFNYPKVAETMGIVGERSAMVSAGAGNW